MRQLHLCIRAARCGVHAVMHIPQVQLASRFVYVKQGFNCLSMVRLSKSSSTQQKTCTVCRCVTRSANDWVHRFYRCAHDAIDTKVSWPPVGILLPGSWHGAILQRHHKHSAECETCKFYEQATRKSASVSHVYTFLSHSTTNPQIR